MSNTPTKQTTQPAPAAVALGAAAIVDVWMGGSQAWRDRMDDSEFLESADWQTAVELSTAVLKATT